MGSGEEDYQRAQTVKTTAISYVLNLKPVCEDFYHRNSNFKFQWFCFAIMVPMNKIYFVLLWKYIINVTWSICSFITNLFVFQ